MIDQARTGSYTSSIKRKQLINSLEDKEYRRAFASDIGTGLAFQIRFLREKRGWTQGELARRLGKVQATISEWENPNYRSYTLKTLAQIADAFDVGLIVKLASFGEMVEWQVGLTPRQIAPPSFEEQRESLHRIADRHSTSN